MRRSTVSVALGLLLWLAASHTSHAEPKAEAPTAAAEGTAAEEAQRRDPRRAARRAGDSEQGEEEREKTIIDRPDRKRPSSPLTFPVFGRPLTLGGRYTVGSKFEGSRLLKFDFLTLDSGDVDGDGNVLEPKDAAEGRFPDADPLRIGQSLQLDAFYRFTPNNSVYIAGRAFWVYLAQADGLRLVNRFDQAGALKRSVWGFARTESWLYFGNVFHTPLSIQIGRQRISDEREWWWDENFDAVRVRFDLEQFHAEISVAQELLPVATNADFIDPEKKDVLNILSLIQWEWAERQRLGFYFLYQWDHSSKLPVGNCVRPLPPNVPPSPFFTLGCIDPNIDDASDADLAWLGVSATGRKKLRGYGLLHYSMNVGGVFGDETLYDVIGTTIQQRVRSVNTHPVHGVGIDLFATWQTRLPARPRLTLGYAFGSGDRGAVDQDDRSFRQTGLQDNNDKFLGVDSFRYYGELLDPELSNLHIVTAGLGFPLLRKSSVELVYHYYRQVNQTRFLRDVGFKRDPTGFNRDVGHEWDVILGIEEWRLLEIEIIGALFRAGKAFAPDDGRLSYLSVAQVRLNF